MVASVEKDEARRTNFDIVYKEDKKRSDSGDAKAEYFILDFEVLDGVKAMAASRFGKFWRGFRNGYKRIKM